VSGDLCLVTGASGFIGSHLARRLARDGYGVRCLVRATSDVGRLEGLELVRGDLSDERSLARAAAGCRYVIHCAALVSDWATVREVRETNVAGTRRLLDASRAAAIERFVQISTTDVYGYPGIAAVEETYAAAGFSNWYAQTKREAEQEVRRAGGFDHVILRPATVYGPGSVEVVGEIARALRAGQMLLIDHGRALAGLVYVENLIDAAALALGAAGASGLAINVTDGLDVTWWRFTNDLAAGLGCRPPRWSIPYGPAYAIAFALEHGYRALRRTTGLSAPALLSRQAVQVLGREQDFSNALARDALGWRPRVSYDDGMKATLAWLREP
jgi:nucleoside-diphosphate-sugar epimerase